VFAVGELVYSTAEIKSVLVVGNRFSSLG